MKRLIIPIILLACACARKEDDPIKLSLLKYHNIEQMEIDSYSVDTITVSEYRDSITNDLFAFPPYKDRLEWARQIVLDDDLRKRDREDEVFYNAVEMADEVLANFDAVDSLTYDYLYSFFYLKNYSNVLLGLDRIMPKEFNAHVQILEKIKNDEPLYRRLEKIRNLDDDSVLYLKVFYTYSFDVSGNKVAVEKIGYLDKDLKMVEN